MDSVARPDLAARLFGRDPRAALVLLRAAWPQAVGPELARRTRVASLDQGVLRVVVPDAGWRRGLLRMRGEILRRLRRVAGDVAPRSIGLVEGPVHAPEEPPAARPPGPTTPPAAVVAAAEAIPDPELRSLFLASAARYFGRFGSSSAQSGGASSGGPSSGGASSGGPASGGPSAAGLSSRDSACDPPSDDASSGASGSD
jgi:uncharacterized membrane protein YgcG